MKLKFKAHQKNAKQNKHKEPGLTDHRPGESDSPEDYYLPSHNRDFYRDFYSLDMKVQVNREIAEVERYAKALEAALINVSPFLIRTLH